MKECKRCLITDSIPGTQIKRGICSYCRVHDRLSAQYPTDNKKLQKIVAKIKKNGEGKRHDCLMGLSGGCDSSYLLYLAVRVFNLRPLVIHFDNRWNTEIAERNMENLVNALDVDFIRYQLGKETYDRLNRAFFEASVTDADVPNDMAMLALFKEVAMQHKIKYTLGGHSFRTEGFSPLAWTYMDAKYIQSVYRSSWGKPLTGFPLLTVWKQVKAAIRGIKEIRLLYYMDYQKDEAKRELRRIFGWKDYGGHHLENRYTAFITSYLLPRKFGIDKRIIEYSALVRSGQMSKEDAAKRLEKKPSVSKAMLDEIKSKYPDFEGVMSQPIKKSFKDFETYHRLFRRWRWLVWIASLLQLVPKTFYIKYTRRI